VRSSESKRANQAAASQDEKECLLSRREIISPSKFDFCWWAASKFEVKKLLMGFFLHAPACSNNVRV